MDQKELADSIGKHLDAAAETVYWALLLAVVFLWAGLTKQDPIKALGMDIARNQALFVACAFYLIANLFVMIHFLRIGDILQRGSGTFLIVLRKQLRMSPIPRSRPIDRNRGRVLTVPAVECQVAPLLHEPRRLARRRGSRGGGRAGHTRSGTMMHPHEYSCFVDECPPSQSDRQDQKAKKAPGA